MSNYWNTIRRFINHGNGRTTVHCTVMLELIAIVCLAAMGSICAGANASAQNVASSAVTSK
ncbi:MAG TPA: hypothetical protein VMJ32_06675 [Pirellulales bacterium]|nr:hypothetical protein [Pirellulales bacterium]